MKQGMALEIMLSGESVLLTGPAGSGKTYVLNRFIEIAKNEGKHVSVTATTGLAATHLGGATIHSWSGIGINDELHINFFDSLSKARHESIGKTDVLIIDEISMLHDFRLDLIDKICRNVRSQDEPFGGIQVIMSGDFFQLPPINRGNSRAGGFVVGSDVWRELEPAVCYLEEQHRQDDEVLLDILNSMRSGDLRRHHAQALLDRVDKLPDDEESLTELHTVNVDVDRINEIKLNALEGDEYKYESASTGSKNYVESLKRSVLAPDVLRLKRGALVMAVKNSLDKKYANGSIGKVVDFTGEEGVHSPIVEFRNGHVITMVQDSWEMRDGEKKRASVTQIPLRLAWAITVHKSQGMTLDVARIDLRKAFVEGMGYVALSRVKNLCNLYLAGINQMALRVSEEAQRIDIDLRHKASLDMKRFKYLEEKIKIRETSKPVLAKEKKKAKSSWQDKISKMREVYPNAYKPWEPMQDAILKEKFLNGVNIEQLTKIMGRHEGSIRMRLQKHFGEDVVQ